MEHEDLMRKLENLETPDIELPGHKQALRIALLNSRHFKQGSAMDWAKILAPVTVAVLVIAVVGFFNVVQPRIEMAHASEIVRNDPYVQELLGERGLEIADVELRDSEAFVLVVLKPVYVELYGNKDLVPAPGETQYSACNISFSGYIFKVDLAAEQVVAFGEVANVTDLGDVKLEDINLAKIAPSESEEPEGDAG